ncbi:MAG: peroxiredoxin [Flavobacterium sp.]
MALQIGDKLPNFTAKDSRGNDFDTQNYIGQKPLVIYFYPKDNTPGCTTQACSFRDQYEDFTDLGAEVIGISSDSEKSHKQFAEQYRLPFILLSDADKSIRKMFGVKTDYFGLLPGRTTYVVDKLGVINYVFDNTSAKKHISNALEAIKKLI